MDAIKETIIPVLEKYGVKKAALFGSYARGDFDASSDVDILIEPPQHMGLSFIRLRRELKESLDKDVDLVSYHGISPYLRENILKYEKRIL